MDDKGNRVVVNSELHNSIEFDMKAGNIKFFNSVDAAMNNDKIAVEVIDKTAYYLAIGLSIIANTRFDSL